LGYAYTNFVTTRLKLRQQADAALCGAGDSDHHFVRVPDLRRSRGLDAAVGFESDFDTLILLAKIVGIPFLVVATSAPLLQRWFTYSGDPSARDPYFLYSASNAGSLLSLLVYPIGIEPTTLLATQSYIFFAGYVALAALILYCAYTIFQVAPSDEQIAASAAEAAAKDAAKHPEPDAAPAPAPAPVTGSGSEHRGQVRRRPAAPTRGIQRKKGAKIPGALDDDKTPSIAHPKRDTVISGADAPMTAWRRIRWVLLAAVPSSLMLGVTSYVSTDLSPFPLIWVLPLALYLLSFIMVYLKGWTSLRLPIGGQGYTMHEITLYVGQRSA